MYPFSVGETRSGRVIKTDLDPSDLDDPRDVLDALAMFERLYLREKEKDEQSDFLQVYGGLAEDLWQIFEVNDERVFLLEDAGIPSRYAIPAYGETLLFAEFRD